MYAITSNKGALKIGLGIDKPEINFTFRDGYIWECEAKSAVGFEMLVDIVSSTITMSILEDVLLEKMKDKEPSETVEWVNEYGVGYFQDYYFSRLVRHQVHRYLQVNERIQIESFETFLLPGIRQDASVYIEHLTTNNESSYPLEEEMSYTSEISDIVSVYKSELEKLENAPNFERFHLIEKDKKHMLLGEYKGQLTVIGKDWLHGVIPELYTVMKIEEDLDTNDPIYFLPLAMHIFDVASIVLHRQNPKRKKIFDQLMVEMEIDEYAMVPCKGCPLCK